MKKFRILIGAAALLVGASIGALVYGQSTVLNYVQSINNTDAFQDLPNGQVGPASSYATALQLAGYTGALLPSSGNALIGGDFTTGQNLWQRGTTVSLASTTYYVAYTADRWFAWGGTSTPATITQQADAPTGYLDSLQIVKGSLTGVVPVTIAQEVESANSYQFAGQTAEFDCHLKALAGFSAANSQVLMTISYGTGVDEGSTYYAYGLNAHGGAGTTAWTGQVNASVLVPITTSWARYTIVAPIPSTASEVAAAIGWTPVGTGTATDGFKMAGCQLVRNPALTSVAGPVYGTAMQYVPSGQSNATPFQRRSNALEAALQERYFWELAEPAAGVLLAPCTEITTGYMICTMQTPVTMRAAPTLAFSTQTTSTWEMFSASATPITLSGATSLVQNALGANTVNTIGLKFTGATTPFTAGYAGTLAGAGGGATMSASSEL
jgi:hypothetical protein